MKKSGVDGDGEKSPASSLMRKKDTDFRSKRNWDEIIGQHSTMMALEPRFMFDGAVLATADAIAENIDAAQADTNAADNNEPQDQQESVHETLMSFGGLMAPAAESLQPNEAPTINVASDANGAIFGQEDVSLALGISVGGC